MGVSSTRAKVFALLSSGLVIGVGATMTMASWTDTEWAYGGTGNLPGVGTSKFDLEQDATNPFSAADVFASSETNPGDLLDFEIGALSLTPGDVVYAPVALRTTSDSTAAGSVVLQPAVQAAGVTATDHVGDPLWNALTVTVGYVIETGTALPPTCDAAGVGGYTSIPLTGTGLGAVPDATVKPAVAAASGTIVHYCFSVSLPAGAASTLQGRTVAPAWSFVGTSS